MRHLTAALDASFATSVYNPSTHGTESMAEQSSPLPEISFKEYGLLHHTDMLVPLSSEEAALFSKTDTFKYVPLHIADPELDNNVSPVDYVLSPPQLKDMNDPTVPDHVRKGVAYDASEIVEFKPEVCT